MATVNIIIEGVALCYEKDGLWKVLFPFNDCHRVKLIYDNGVTKTLIGELGKEGNTIEVTAESPIPPNATATPAFEDILNLTSDDTHTIVKMRDEWEKSGVLLTVKDIQLDVKDFLHTFPGVDFLDVFLSDGANEIQLHGSVGHSVKGKILLDAGGKVVVKSVGNPPFSTGVDESCTLIFDNDCHRKNPPGVNDMDMLYKVIQDAEAQHENRQFRVFGRPKPNSAKPIPEKLLDTGPPLLLEGKPCMVVKVTKTDFLE